MSKVSPSDEKEISFFRPRLVRGAVGVPFFNYTSKTKSGHGKKKSRHKASPVENENVRRDQRLLQSVFRGRQRRLTTA
jgi:hypothetical protein